MDTHPTIERFIIDGLRRMTSAEKLERVRQLTRAVHALSLIDVRRNHPNAGERELLLRAASRRLDPELMRRAFGWDPDREGF